jgi:exosortase family protein XrtF
LSENTDAWNGRSSGTDPAFLGELASGVLGLVSRGLYLGEAMNVFRQALQQFQEVRREQPELVRFIAVGLLGYVAWYAAYAYWLRPGTLLDEYVIHSMVLSCEWATTAMGWEVWPPAEDGLRHTLGIAGTGRLGIGDSCDGVVLFALFTLFMLAFPGPWRQKLWYIPAGIALLHGANIARVVALMIIQWGAPEWLDFNHHYTFTVLIYGLVFFLWYVWARLHVPLPSTGHE